jgi:NhaP-type Na+/H+ or K+/H+ antiporter
MTWALATIAALLIAYATVSRRLESRSVSGAMLFTTAGLLVGPVLGLLDLQVRGEQVKLLGEITLTLVLFADASRIRCRRCTANMPCRCAFWGSGCRSRLWPEL